MMKRDGESGSGANSLARAAFAADELRALGEQVNREFPLRLDQPGLQLIDVDPWHLHVYWNQPKTSVETTLAEMAGPGEAQLVLRFRDIPLSGSATEGLHPTVHAFDIPIQAAAGQMQVRAPSPGHCYEVELGVTAMDGGWRMLARSRQVCMPRQAPLRQTAGLSVELDWRAQAEPRPGLVSPSAENSVLPALDPSLDGDFDSELKPEFPNTAPLPSFRTPELQPQGDTLRLADMALEEEHGMPESALGSGRNTSSRAGHASSYTNAFELRTQLYLSGHAEPGRIVEIYGLQMTVDERGDFDLLKDLDPDNPLIALLLQPPKT